MKSYIIWICAGAMCVTATTALSGNRVCARRYSGLPCYNYTPARLSAPVVATTFGPFPVRPVGVSSGVAAAAVPPLGTAPTPAPVAEALPSSINVFQLAQPALQIDQCQISGVAITLRQDGRWFINYVGVQDPKLAGAQKMAQVSALKGNNFHVRIRAFGIASPQAGAGGMALAPCELFSLETEPQWFDRGETRAIRLESPIFNPAVRENFEFVQRMEVEFRYE